MIGVGLIVALLPQRVHAMTDTVSSIGWLAAAFAITYLSAQIPIGVLADTFGPKRFLVAGYLTCSLSGLVFMFACTPTGIFFGRAVQGLGEAPIWALAPALLSVAYPNRTGWAIGIYNASLHAGLTLGPLLGLLLAGSADDTVPFVIYAVLCALAAVFVLAFLRMPTLQGQVRTAKLGSTRALLRSRRLLLVLAGVTLYGAGYGSFVSVLPIALTATHGLDSASVNIQFMLFYGMISASQMIVGIASDRFGRQRFLVWGLGLTSLGIGAFAGVPGLWVLVPFAVASIGLGMFCVTSTAELNDSVSEDQRGAVSGGYFFFWGIGYVCGPLLLGAAVAELRDTAYLGLALLFAVHAGWLSRRTR